MDGHGIPLKCCISYNVLPNTSAIACGHGTSESNLTRPTLHTHSSQIQPISWTMVGHLNQEQKLHVGIVETLNKLNFRVEVESDFATNTTSHDGFVFASSPRVTQVFSNFDT